MKLNKERAEYIRSLVSSLPPFSITFTDPVDASWLVSACIGHIAGTDKKTGEILSIALGASCRLLGVEDGVEAWIDALNSTRDLPIPKFIKPLMIHHFNHIKAALEKEKE